MKRFLLLLGSAALLVLSSCSKFDKTPFWKEGDMVDDFVRGANYPATESFQSDLDALVTYALDIRAVRWGYYALVSKGGGKNQPFSSSLDDLDNNAACKAATQDLYRYLDGIMARSEVYEEAISRLEASGVLNHPATRGMFSDAFDFMAGCKKAGIVSRKSLVTTMRELGWTRDQNKLEDLFYSIPAAQRDDYSDYVEFWKDFSSGKLDNRASQIYVNLYNFGDPELGDKARDLGITPGKNITVVGAELIEKGASLVIDASPMSTQLGYGKDIFNSITATEKLITEGDVKGFLQNAAGNLVNYGRDAAKLADKLRGLDINYWDYGDQFWDLIGKDIATIWYNDCCFTEEYKNIMDKGEGERLIPNLVKTKDLNGQDIMLVVMVDEGTGHVSISYVLDMDGNVITNPQIPGPKIITVVNSTTGKRVTKTIEVDPTGDTEVEVDLDFDEKMLEEEPANGELKLDPKSIDDKTGEGGYFYTKIDTNYLYYTCKSEDSWIECYIPTDVNIVYIKLTQNLTGKERTGKITVAATNSQGKVLKTTVMMVTQKPFEASEYAIKATPDGLEFDKNEGSQVVYVTLPGSVRSWGVEPDNKLVGWATVTPFMESDIYPAVTVSVKENKTKKDRSSSFYIWASYDEKGKKIDYKTTVIVKQSAEEAGEKPVMKFGCCKVWGSFKGKVDRSSDLGQDDPGDEYGFNFGGWLYSKEYITNYYEKNYKNNKCYKDFSFPVDNISITQSGKYYIVQMDAAYSWQHDKSTYGYFHAQSWETHMTIKLLPSNLSDINTWKVVSCSCNSKVYDGDYDDTEEYELEFEADVPFLKKEYNATEWNYNYSYLFRLDGTKVPKGCVKKYSHKKSTTNSWYLNTANNVTTDENNRISIYLYIPNDK